MKSQLGLGQLYQKGQFVEKDDAQAIVWFRKAADAGDAIAQFSLAWQYRHGTGIPKDMDAAAKWAALSAAQGYVLAENSMGYSFDQGVGVKQDLVEAYKWYALAIAQGNGDAKVNMERLRPRLSADQIAEGQRRSTAFVPTAPAAQSPK